MPTACLVLNIDAGRLSQLGEDDRVAMIERLRAIAAKHGWDLAYRCLPAGEVAGAIDRAFHASPGALFIGGGDGTIKGAVAQLAGGDVPLGILPLGTMNLLAHDLGLPLDADAAFEAQITGNPRNIDVARVNGETFVNSVRMGFVTRMTAGREWARRKGHRGLRRWWAMLRAGWTVLRTRRRLVIQLVPVDGPSVALRCYGLMITNNRYDPSPANLLQRTEVDGGYLTVYAPKHRSPWGIVKLALSATLGTWRSDPLLAAFETTSLTVQARKRKLQASIDGELELIDSPMEITVWPRALPVLMPRQPD